MGGNRASWEHKPTTIIDPDSTYENRDASKAANAVICAARAPGATSRGEILGKGRKWGENDSKNQRGWKHTVQTQHTSRVKVARLIYMMKSNQCCRVLQLRFHRGSALDERVPTTGSQCTQAVLSPGRRACSFLFLISEQEKCDSEWKSVKSEVVCCGAVQGLFTLTPYLGACSGTVHCVFWNIRSNRLPYQPQMQTCWSNKRRSKRYVLSHSPTPLSLYI